MAKELTEMTLEELWRLFPIVLKEYNPQYPQWYEQEKEELEAIFAEDALVRISHIGSTSVPGLLSKPIIDILVELSAIADVPIWKKKLEDSGWLCMSQERAPEYKLAFNKGYTPVGFDEKVFHLHVRTHRGWDELYFRDYLREFPDTAREYAELKRRLKEKYEYNRNAYTEAKTKFIRNCTEKARKLYGKRYE